MGFPPHARGWTVMTSPKLSEPFVSPARAGMDPTLSTEFPLPTCFPRTRGDGPVRASVPP